MRDDDEREQPEHEREDSAAQEGIERDSDDGQDEAPDKRKWRLIALAVLLAGLGIAAALYFLRPQQEGSEPPDRPPLVSVERIRAQTSPIIITGQGEVRAANELGLALQLSGRVVYVNPDLREGRRVRRGETLLRIEPDDFRNQVTAARSDVERARVDLQQAIETRETRREEFERLRERLAREEQTQAGDIDADFVRPGEDAGAQNARDDVSVDPSALALGEPQVEAAQAALEGAEARLRNARLNVSRTSVTAPFDAVVRSQSVERGQFVQAGQQVAQLYNANAVEIAVPLTQEKVALIPRLFASVRSGGMAGAPATVKVDFGGATYAWDAQVGGAQGAIESRTRTLEVIVRVARPTSGGTLLSDEGAASGAPPLLPGFFATVEFIAETPPSYFALPSDAVRADDVVWTVRDGRVAFQPVRVIARDGDTVFVNADGLEDGATVITGDIASVSEGMQVRTSRDNQAPAVEAQQSGGEQPRYRDDAE